VALLEKRGFLYNHSGDFPQVILIVPSHVPNNGQQEYLDSVDKEIKSKEWCLDSAGLGLSFKFE
jgi:hypothetical protein